MPIVTAIPNDLVTPHRVIHFPAHPNNFSPASAPIHGGYRRRTKAAALVWHTPEEAVDDVESTPAYFARDLLPEGRRASTDAYADSDGDLYVMVSDQDSPFANGVRADRRIWQGVAGARPPWATPGVSYNVLTRSMEIEGRAATMHRTFKVGGEQWKTVVAWSAFWTRRDEIPIDRRHLVGHQELDTNKGDPGITVGFPIDDLVEAVRRAVREPARLGYVEAMRRAAMGAMQLGSHRLAFISDDGRHETWELSFPSRRRGR